MRMIYDYGPDIQFNISTTGDMLLYNGPYENINVQEKHLLQAICHMVYQIKNEFEDEVSTIQLNDTWIMKAQNCYSLYTSSMMTVFNIKEVGKYSYEVDFFHLTNLSKLIHSSIMPVRMLLRTANPGN